MKTLSIVIPVFNEEKFIEKTIQKVWHAKTPGFSKEIVIIDDGSKDSTPKILQKYKRKKNNKLQILIKKVNEGKGAALRDGFKLTTGDYVVIQDADLEYNPDDIEKLLKPITESGADVVYGSRLLTSESHRVLYFWHSIVNSLLTTFSNMLTNINLTDMETGYKLFRGDVIRKIAPNLVSDRFGFEPEITAKIAKIKGLKIFEVGISYAGRTYEEGKKIDWRDGLRAVWEIIRFNLF